MGGIRYITGDPFVPPSQVGTSIGMLSPPWRHDAHGQAPRREPRLHGPLIPSETGKIEEPP